MKRNSEVSTYEQMVSAKYAEMNGNEQDGIKWAHCHSQNGIVNVNSLIVGNTPSWMQNIGFERVIAYERDSFLYSKNKKQDMLLLPRLINEPIAIVAEQTPSSPSYGDMHFLSSLKDEYGDDQYYVSTIKVDEYHRSLLRPCHSSMVTDFNKITKQQFNSYLLSAAEPKHKLIYFNANRYHRLNSQIKEYEDRQSVKKLIRNTKQVFNSPYVTEVLFNRDIKTAAYSEIEKLIGNENENNKDVRFDPYGEAIATLMKANTSNKNMFFEIMQAKKVIDGTYELMHDRPLEIQQAKQYTDVLFANAYARHMTPEFKSGLKERLVNIINQMPPARSDFKDNEVDPSIMRNPEDRKYEIKRMQYHLAASFGYNTVFVDAIKDIDETEKSFINRQSMIEKGRKAIENMQDIKQAVNSAVKEKLEAIDLASQGYQKETSKVIIISNNEIERA